MTVVEGTGQNIPEMPVDDDADLIQRALREFDVPNASVEHLAFIDHLNAKVVTPAGSFFLKILSTDHTATHLRSRLQFVEFLRSGGLNVPETNAAKTGQPFATVLVGEHERHAVLSRWIDGETAGDRTDGHWIEMCGELLARLHCRSQEFDPPDAFEVRAWDDVCIPREDGWLRTFLDNSPVDATARQIIEQAAVRVRRIDAQLPRGRQTYGLIHADFHGDNLIFDGETIWLVDLDDAGWGHFLFDVTWPAVLFAKHHPTEGEFLAPFLRGYECIRSLTVEERELLPEFQLAAGFGVLEMVDSSPIANDSPKAQDWLRSIVAWLERHLETSGTR